jgi:hypothetical protein
MAAALPEARVRPRRAGARRAEGAPAARGGA